MRPGPAPGLFASGGWLSPAQAWSAWLPCILLPYICALQHRMVQRSIGHVVRCCSPPWEFPPRLGPPFGAAPFLEGRSMFQLERWLMLPASLTPVAQLSCEALRLGCEAYSLIGLRLFKMVTGGVPAVSEALRMVPEKITALIDAQILVAASVLSGRPDLALGRVVALYRDRVSDNEQRLTA